MRKIYHEICLADKFPVGFIAKSYAVTDYWEEKTVLHVATSFSIKKKHFSINETFLDLIFYHHFKEHSMMNDKWNAFYDI